MKKRNFFAFCALLLCCMSCDNESAYEGNPVGGESADRELKVSSVITENHAVSRAPQLDAYGQGTFSLGDKNRLLFLSTAGEAVQSFEYTYGKTTYWSDIRLPQTMTTGKVVAWYPAVDAVSPQNFEWNVKNVSDPDLLVADAIAMQANQERPLQFTFRHKMHKLHVGLVSGDPTVTESDLAQASITCRNFYPAVSVNLVKGTTGAVSGGLQSQAVTARQCDFIIPAQPAGTVEVEIKLKNRTKVFRMAETVVDGSVLKQFESGKTLSLTVTVTQSTMELTLTADIEGWEVQGQKSDSMII